MGGLKGIQPASAGRATHTSASRFKRSGMVEVFMNSSYLKRIARSLVTGMVLLTVLVTTLLPGWAGRANAAAAEVGLAAASA